MAAVRRRGAGHPGHRRRPGPERPARPDRARHRPRGSGDRGRGRRHRGRGLPGLRAPVRAVPSGSSSRAATGRSTRAPSAWSSCTRMPSGSSSRPDWASSRACWDSSPGSSRAGALAPCTHGPTDDPHPGPGTRCAYRCRVAAELPVRRRHPRALVRSARRATSPRVSVVPGGLGGTCAAAARDRGARAGARARGASTGRPDPLRRPAPDGGAGAQRASPNVPRPPRPWSPSPDRP